MTKELEVVRDLAYENLSDEKRLKVNTINYGLNILAIMKNSFGLSIPTISHIIKYLDTINSIERLESLFEFINSVDADKDGVEIPTELINK